MKKTELLSIIESIEKDMEVNVRKSIIQMIISRKALYYYSLIDLFNPFPNKKLISSILSELVGVGFCTWNKGTGEIVYTKK